MEISLNRNLDTYRRRTGLILGVSLGLTYGLISQLINSLFLPGVPLYQPPFGPLGNTLLFILLGLVFGLLSSWLDGSIASIFLASGISGALVSGVNFFTGSLSTDNLAARLVSAVFLYLPLAAAFIPAAGIFRWVVNGQVEFYAQRSTSRKHLLAPLLFVLFFIALGLFSLRPPDARTMLSRAHLLIQTGQQAASPDALPAALQPPDIEGFAQAAQGRYTVEWDRDVDNHYHFPRPLLTPEKQALVIARFESGWNLVCLFVNPTADPKCRGFYGTQVPLAW